MERLLKHGKNGKLEILNCEKRAVKGNDGSLLENENVDIPEGAAIE